MSGAVPGCRCDLSFGAEERACWRQRNPGRGNDTSPARAFQTLNENRMSSSGGDPPGSPVEDGTGHQVSAFEDPPAGTVGQCDRHDAPANALPTGRRHHRRCTLLVEQAIADSDIRRRDQFGSHGFITYTGPPTPLQAFWVADSAGYCHREPAGITEGGYAATMSANRSRPCRSVPPPPVRLTATLASVQSRGFRGVMPQLRSLNQERVSPALAPVGCRLAVGLLVRLRGPQPDMQPVG